jgi:hypothetical protein
MLVDAHTGASADAGSIPAASIFWLNRAASAVSFGGNDFVLPLLFQPARVGVHRGLEVGLVAMAVDAERRVEVGVASTSSTRVSNAGWTASDSACGFELDFVLRPLEPSRTRDSRITKNLVRSPQDRVRKLLRGMRD